MPSGKDTWLVEKGVLRVRIPGEGTITPTASEVIGAEFKCRYRIRAGEITRRPSDDLPEIEFHRFAPDVRVLVCPPSPDLSSQATCLIELRLDGRNIPLTNGPQPTVDHVLVEKEWIPLPMASLVEAGDLLKSAGIALPGSITLSQYVGLRSNKSELLIFLPSPIAKSAAVPADHRPLPAGLSATLYSYQEDGVRWMRRVADESVGCILADEMGLGKTLQVIALLLSETSERRTPSLIVAPATLVENWRREISRFAPSLNVNVHCGSGRTGFPNTLRKWDVVITTYDTAVRDLSMLCMIRWNVVVLDEAQSIKTPTVQRTKGIKTLPRRVAIAVTGTPVENHLRDLWSIMDFAVPGFLGSQWDFETGYENSVADASKLEPLVSPFMLRRRVSAVAKDLPPRIDIPQAIELSEESAFRYEAIRKEIAAKYGASASLVSIIRLRQFCAHPFLIDPADGDPAAASTKYERLIEILDEVQSLGEKSIIFTSFQEMTDILAADLEGNHGFRARQIDGRTVVADRQKLVDEFQSAVGGSVLILNPKAAGVGLNITAASHVIHYNLEWNPAVEDQATARAYRRGQTRPVTVHRLYHSGTIEEIIDDRLRLKRDIAGEAVLGIDGRSADMTDILRAIEISPVRGKADVDEK